MTIPHVFTLVVKCLCIFLYCLVYNDTWKNMAFHSLLWRLVVLLTVGVYSSNQSLLYAIRICITRRFQKSVGSSVCAFVSLCGWLYLYSFICLSAGVVEWQPYCFVILLHHAPLEVASVLVLFVTFGGFFLVLIYR